MATTAQDCVALVEQARLLGRRLVVCHVLRYAPFFVALHGVLRSGRLGDVVSIDWRENLSYQHFVHSFVRGNWSNTRRTAPMVLAKCSHDLDQLGLGGGPDARAGVVIRVVDALHRRAGRGGHAGALHRWVPTSGGLPLVRARRVRGRRHARLHARPGRPLARAGGDPGGAAHRSLRSLRLPLRQRRGRPPGGHARLRRGPDGEPHDAGCVAPRGPHGPGGRHARHAARGPGSQRDPDLGSRRPRTGGPAPGAARGRPSRRRPRGWRPGVAGGLRVGPARRARGGGHRGGGVVAQPPAGVRRRGGATLRRRRPSRPVPDRPRRRGRPGSAVAGAGVGRLPGRGRRAGRFRGRFPANGRGTHG